MADIRFKNTTLYKKEDLLSQEIFGIEYFNWLDYFEQRHLVHKFDLDEDIQTKY
jgi:hypothetical protein